jgi:hypothetical protein
MRPTPRRSPRPPRAAGPNRPLRRVVTTESQDRDMPRHRPSNHNVQPMPGHAQDRPLTVKGRCGYRRLESCARNSLPRSGLMRWRLTVTAITLRISQNHRAGTCRALPWVAHSRSSSEAGVVSSSQHQSMHAETSRTKPGFNTCAQYEPFRGSAFPAAQAERLYATHEFAARRDGLLPDRNQLYAARPQLPW